MSFGLRIVCVLATGLLWVCFNIFKSWKGVFCVYLNGKKNRKSSKIRDYYFGYYKFLNTFDVFYLAHATLKLWIVLGSSPTGVFIIFPRLFSTTEYCVFNNLSLCTEILKLNAFNCTCLCNLSAKRQMFDVDFAWEEIIIFDR